ncbi:hypothetical protein CBR_g53742 [Chara braunii]|uniref:RRM domain-containing protein n=1 Tax=Chara braunii TaxID=69332 RepID=A0A388MB89_CHABU|nr:hypothetical protein CBR_g53742 [Chara braunii]|eukprot:GBG91851.1 hypothetical protein CBR_g53742 [Chara braunii]
MTTVTPAVSASLYVGDLDKDVTEAQLYELFSQVGQVASIRVCRDAVTRRSLGYAYVNYNSTVDAERAMEALNYTALNSKPVRIMWSHRDPSTRKSGVGNIFIKNLEESIDNKALHDTFVIFGNILSCKVATDGGKSKGYGFVHFETKEAAALAIEKVNGKLLKDKKVFVGPFVKKTDRQENGTEPKFTNVYIKNIDSDVTEDMLRQRFEEFGKITNLVIMRDENDKPKGFGFVNFEKPECAKAAVDKMNGTVIGTKAIYCGRAQKKAERDAFLKQKFEERRLERIQKYQGVNLYIKNLEDSIDDERLRMEFGTYGTITSARVMRDEKGISKGFGFVCFTAPEEATKAVTEANGRMLNGKPIYVALAQRKEVRRAQLEQHYAQRLVIARPGAAGASLPPATPGPPVYPPGAPVYYQAAPGVVPPTAQRLYPPMMARGAWRATGPAPPPARPAFQTVSNYVRNRGQTVKYIPNGRPRDTSIIPGIVPQGQVVPAGPPVPVAIPVPVGAGVVPGVPSHPEILTTSMLAAAPPHQQKQMLGERLFPLVHRLQDFRASKNQRPAAWCKKQVEGVHDFRASKKQTVEDFPGNTEGQNLQRIVKDLRQHNMPNISGG